MSESKMASVDESGLSEMLSAMSGQSLNFVSDAYWRWLKNANATSAELLRFVKERFNKDMQLMSRCIACEKPEDFLALRSEASDASDQWRMNIGS